MVSDVPLISTVEISTPTVGMVASEWSPSSSESIHNCLSRLMSSDLPEFSGPRSSSSTIGRGGAPSHRSFLFCDFSLQYCWVATLTQIRKLELRAFDFWELRRPNLIVRGQLCRATAWGINYPVVTSGRILLFRTHACYTVVVVDLRLFREFRTHNKIM